MVTKYEQQATVATETIMQGKAKISSWTETIKLHELRIKEIETLKSRTHDEKDEKWEAEYAKWVEEETKLKEEMVHQHQLIEVETTHVTEYEQQSSVLINTIKTFNKHIKKVDSITEILNKKVTETKTALKPA